MSLHRRSLIGVAVIALIGGTIYFFRSGSDLPVPPPATAPASPPPAPTLPSIEDVIVPPAARQASQQLISQEDSDPVADLHTLQDLLTLYRRGNEGVNPPGGENEEIVAGLIGRNPKRLAVIPPDHPKIDANGRLLDRWGTPYWFHPISGKVIEIHSAGPDKSLFTDDDILIDTP